MESSFNKRNRSGNVATYLKGTAALLAIGMLVACNGGNEVSSLPEDSTILTTKMTNEITTPTKPDVVSGIDDPTDDKVEASTEPITEPHSIDKNGNALVGKGGEPLSAAEDTTSSAAETTTEKKTQPSTASVPKSTKNTAETTEGVSAEKVFNVETVKEIATNTVKAKGYKITSVDPMLLHGDTKLYSCIVVANAGKPGYDITVEFTIDPYVDPKGRILSIRYSQVYMQGREDFISAKNFIALDSGVGDGNNYPD